MDTLLCIEQKQICFHNAAWKTVSFIGYHEVESEQVLDEGEFIKFFHRLLERPDLDELFEIASCKYKGNKNMQVQACFKNYRQGGGSI